jgi:UDP-N-acetyl-D-galactosamine dehydrogenase
MGMFVANKVIKLMIKKGHKIEGARALILGITFKENCPDIRNSRVIDIYRELKEFGLSVDVYDPHALPVAVEREYELTLKQTLNNRYDAIILTVAHQEFKLLDLGALRDGQKAVVFDTKAFLDREWVDARL